MQCKKIKEMLPSYTGGELPMFKAWIVKRHLRHCSLCREEALFLAKISETSAHVLRKQRAKLPKADIWQNIASSLPAENKTVPHVNAQANWLTNRWKGLAAAGLACATILLFVIVGIRKLPHSPNQSAQAMQDKLPTVEHVYTPNTTVMTIETNDPNLKIVWLFQENTKPKNQTNGG